jgi:hypothetical protein
MHACSGLTLTSPGAAASTGGLHHCMHAKHSHYYSAAAALCIGRGLQIHMPIPPATSIHS